MTNKGHLCPEKRFNQHRSQQDKKKGLQLDKTQNRHTLTNHIFVY